MNFERVFCINLDRRPERWAEFQQTYPACFPPVARWSATDGQAIAFPTDWAPRAAWEKHGWWGSTLSHTAVLDCCVSEDVQSVLIFEDDATPPGEYVCAEWESFCAELPDDWQWLYFGGNTKYDGICTRISEYVYRPCPILDVHAYALRGPLIAKLLGELRNPDNYHEEVHCVDRVFREYQRRNRPAGLYCPSRWLFMQRAGYSDGEYEYLAVNHKFVAHPRDQKEEPPPPPPHRRCAAVPIGGRLKWMDVEI